MQIVVVFLLASLVGSYGDENSCVVTVARCIFGHTDSLSDASSREERCKIMTDAVECLGDAYETCAEEQDEDNKKAIDGLKEMQNIYCNKPNVAEDEEMEKCIEDNKESLGECRVESDLKVLTILADQMDEENYEERLKCNQYMENGQCEVKKIEEKCGFKALVKVSMRMYDSIPDDVLQACETVGIGFISGYRPDDDKKK